MSDSYSKDEFDAMTGGFHPRSVCGENCSGCRDPQVVPLSSFDRVDFAELTGEFDQ